MKTLRPTLRALLLNCGERPAITDADLATYSRRWMRDCGEHPVVTDAQLAAYTAAQVRR